MLTSRCRASKTFVLTHVAENIRPTDLRYHGGVCGQELRGADLCGDCLTALNHLVESRVLCEGDESGDWLTVFGDHERFPFLDAREYAGDILTQLPKTYPVVIHSSTV